jgi:hypothetical protein
VDWDRVVAAAERHALANGQVVQHRQDRPEASSFMVDDYEYDARAADWLIAEAAWVDDAVRMVADRFMDNFAITYGLVFAGDEDLFLNDPETIRALGRRLGAGVDPIAYAELLAELYSGRHIDDQTVLPFSATGSHRAGVLVRDPARFAAEYEWVDPALVRAPEVRAIAGGGVEMGFCSVRYFLTETRSAVDVLQWTVVGGGGRPASWSRRYLVERAEGPYRVG